MDGNKYVVMRNTCYYRLCSKTGTVSWTPFLSDATLFSTRAYADSVASKYNGVVAITNEFESAKETTYTVYMMVGRLNHASIRAGFTGVLKDDVGALRLRAVMWAQSIDDLVTLKVIVKPSGTLTEPA